MSDRIYSEVLRVIQRYRTRDPFDLLDAMGVTVFFSDKFQKDGLKGFCTCANRFLYVVINAKLCPEERRIVAAHELGHLVLHQSKLKLGAFRDNDVYCPTNRWEKEANCFAADLLCADEDVTEAMKTEDSDFFDVARQLYVPAPFFAFKLYSMMDRGFPVRLPVELNSTFLGKSR